MESPRPNESFTSKLRIKDQVCSGYDGDIACTIDLWSNGQVSFYTSNSRHEPIDELVQKAAAAESKWQELDEQTKERLRNTTWIKDELVAFAVRQEKLAAEFRRIKDTIQHRS